MATGIKQQSKNPIKSQEFLARLLSSLSLALFSSSFSIPRPRGVHFHAAFESGRPESVACPAASGAIVASERSFASPASPNERR